MTKRTIGTLVQIDPTEVIIGTNVRLDARVDKRFIASVRERGVLVPIVGHYDEHGQFVVLYGQRRTLAAVETKQASIPAYVVATTEDADRLIDQLAENDHRTPLTTAERAHAFEQMSALGLSAAQIAKRTATGREQVSAALQVAASDLASKAVDRWDFLTLEQGAALAEFETNPQAIEDLTLAAKRGQFDHTLQRLRDKRDERAEADAFAATLTEAGITVVDHVDWRHPTAKPLTDLADPDDEDRQPLTPEAHDGCPGHAAFVSRDWEWRADDEEHDEETERDDEEDSDDENDDDRDAGRYVFRARYVCTDWKGNGHRERWGDHSPNQRPKAAEMSEDEREQAKAARRDVIESNKAWDSAEKVRKMWVTRFLTRKTAPKGSATFIAVAMIEHADRLSHHQTPDAIKALLGLERRYGSHAAADTIEQGSDARALVVALGLTLAAYESHTNRSSWRTVDSGTARYLHFLAANGYDLSTVEQRATGQTIPAPHSDADADADA